MSGKKRKNWFGITPLKILVFVIISILFLHSFLLINNVEQRLSMIRNIINNERDYKLLISIINASQVSLGAYLSVLNDLSKYQMQTKSYNINFSVSDYPQWPIQLTSKVTAQKINTLVQKNSFQVKISYLLKNGKWLNYSERPHFTAYNLTVMLFLVEAALLAGFLFYGWSVYRLKMPLEKLKSSAERLGIDFKALPMNETGPALVRNTVKAMNLLQERVQELIQNRTQLLATISHDLRTPITRLQLRVQFLNDEEHAQKIIADLEEMQNMIDGVLSFARHDVFHEAKTKFDLVSLILTICNDFIDLGNRIQLTTEINTCDFYGRRIALKRCFSNVIHNATKFGKHLNVKIERTTPYVTIAIEDDGPGLSEEEFNLIFKPFYRCSKSSLKNTTGAGLGLTVAYEVVKDHQGEIKLENIIPHGLCVLIILPANSLQS